MYRRMVQQDMDQANQERGRGTSLQGKRKFRNLEVKFKYLEDKLKICRAKLKKLTRKQQELVEWNDEFQKRL